LLEEAVRLQSVALRAYPKNPIDLQASRRHQELRRRLEARVVKPPG
jgi:hypothetical protein